MSTRFWRIYRYAAYLLGLALLVAMPVRAAVLSQGYKTDQAYVAGTVVGLDPTASDTVQASNTDNLDELLGVVVTTDSTLLAVSNAGSNTQVVTSGTTATLVSTLGGDIKKGDPITASAISGVGQKASAAGRILGLAEDDFSASSPGAVEKEVDSKTGKVKVSVGSIPVLVSVGYFTPKGSKSIVPQGIQSLSNYIAGREVPTFRIIAAIILLAIGLALAAIILSSAVRSSMSSIGRNPLAKSAINNGLLKVIFLTFLILLVTLASVYFVVRG